jgi:hypothetical protein
MNIREYQDAVIALFKSGKATDEMWVEMANAVLSASESFSDAVPAIDVAVGADEDEAGAGGEG